MLRRGALSVPSFYIYRGGNNMKELTVSMIVLLNLFEGERDRYEFKKVFASFLKSIPYRDNVRLDHLHLRVSVSNTKTESVDLVIHIISYNLHTISILNGREFSCTVPLYLVNKLDRLG